MAPTWDLGQPRILGDGFQALDFSGKNSLIFLESVIIVCRRLGRLATRLLKAGAKSFRVRLQCQENGFV
jgi:hypothetical protein